MTDEVLERILISFAALVERHLRTGRQMCGREYATIAAAVNHFSPGNVLIFGCGHDSLMWSDLNRGGRTLFVENVPKWSEQARAAKLEVIDVVYDSLLKEWMNRVQLPSGLSEDIIQLPWNVVLVDAPLGVGKSPGREQSIFAASRIRRRSDAVIFVHDYQRPWERACCDKYLGPPTQTIVNLAIWKRMK
jgi:hypothetical protein